jgi:hypothetical protein
LWALASAALLSADCSAPGFGFEAPLGLFLAVELAAALLSVALFHSEALSRKPRAATEVPSVVSSTLASRDNVVRTATDSL